MDEKEVLIAMKRLQKIEDEAKKRILEQKMQKLSLKQKVPISKMGIQKSKPSNAVSSPKVYCSIITEKGVQCSRYQVENCNKMCKQHFDNSGKDIVMKNIKPPKPKISKAKVLETFVPMDVDDDPRPPKSSKPKKKEAIPAAIKTLVWNKWVGEKEAEAGCYACKVTTITMRHFHCGHVVSEKHGGKCTIDNLRPICQPCNLSMGTMNMNEYITKFGLHK
jgi:hypothetical protein